MAWRRLVPLLLVGLLGAAVAGAAALGATESPSPLSAQEQSQQFHLAVERTLEAKSFTMHFADQDVIYQAPNRVRVVEGGLGAAGFGISLVTIGSNSYADFGSGPWQKVSTELLGPATSANALGYLRALSSFKAATLSGDVYTVHGVLSQLPKPLVTVIFTTVTHGPNGQSGSSFGLDNPNEDAKVVGRVVVVDGRITSETFTAIGVYPRHGRDGGSRTGSVKYSAFDSFPPIAAPTKADLAPATPPCHPDSDGSCQVTTKGRDPRSAMCKALHADNPTRAEEQFAADQAAAKSGQWSAEKKGELDLLALLGKAARTVALSPHLPDNVRTAVETETSYIRQVRAALLTSNSFSQFSASSSSIEVKAFGGFAVLIPYETKQCGGTTTYSGVSVSRSVSGTQSP